MEKTEISLDEAKRFIINSQLLDKSTKTDNLIEIFETLGYIQIDTISKINRSHHHTLWTRIPEYNEENLFSLQSKEKKIFEYWGHAMSFLPMSEYRFMIPKMENFKNPSSFWVKNHLTKSKDYLNKVKKRIEIEGPLSSKDFDSNKKKNNGWWDWKPAKFALEYLFWCGDLMVRERKGFRKIYDLTERVLPENINLQKPKKLELAEFLVKKGLSAMGIATENELTSFLQSSASRDTELLIADKNTINETIKILIESRKIIKIIIENNQKRPYYALKEKLNQFNPKVEVDPVLHLLSPFDNLIIARKRVKNLFDFNYTLECYKPAAKREYGYFVLPILYKKDLVGRMDPNADKKKKILYINNLIFEDVFNPDLDFFTLFADKLVSFAKFNNCNQIEILSGELLDSIKPLIKNSFNKRA